MGISTTKVSWVGRCEALVGGCEERRGELWKFHLAQNRAQLESSVYLWCGRARFGKPGKTQVEERIHDPFMRIDNDLAVVWARFVFLADGKVNHCGTDLFNLIRVEGKWQIASIADTGKKDCEAQ